MSSSKVLSDLVKIPIETLREASGENEATFLDGKLRIPQSPEGIIIFAHGSGSGRHSPRNQFVAEKLNEDGLATLLLDLLTPDEEELDNQTRKLRFDIGLLSKRLISTINWVTNNRDTKNLAIGLFGASTGAAAALLLHVFRRSPAPAWRRRDPRLGALALPDGPARPCALRRHASLRACRSASGIPPGMEQLDLQLRPCRGAQLPREQRAVLARHLSHRRATRRCGRLDAVSRLRPARRRVDSQPLRRARDPRRRRVPQTAHSRRLPGSS